jgi:hypothetical protein
MRTFHALVATALILGALPVSGEGQDPNTAGPLAAGASRPVSAVLARSDMAHISKGDVRSVLEAFPSGGWAVLLHSTIAKAAPADVFGGAIRPFAGSPWDGVHLCADDWHVAVFADIEGGDTTFTRTAAEAIMQGLDVAFTLDGAPLETQRTAVKRYLNPAYFGLEEAYAFQQGHILAPEDLTVGRHTLGLAIHQMSSGQDFIDGVTFFVDPSDHGACQQRPGP